MSAPLHVWLGGHPEEPGFDTGLTRAILLRVHRGELPETVRLFRPGRIVAFGSRDVAHPGYAAAAEAAAGQGFEAIQRLAGGRAAVFTPATLAFARAVPDPEPARGIHARFADMAGRLTSALRALGVDARTGEIPGEYCPGAYSVNARGGVKIAGIGQRLVRRAAHVGGVLVVGDRIPIRDVLDPVYDALEVPWDPRTVGSVTDEVGDIGWERVRDTVLETFAAERDIEDWEPDETTLRLAAELAPDHVRRPAPSVG